MNRMNGIDGIDRIDRIDGIDGIDGVDGVDGVDGIRTITLMLSKSCWSGIFVFLTNFSASSGKSCTTSLENRNRGRK